MTITISGGGGGGAFESNSNHRSHGRAAAMNSNNSTSNNNKSSQSLTLSSIMTKWLFLLLMLCVSGTIIIFVEMNGYISDPSSSSSSISSLSSSSALSSTLLSLSSFTYNGDASAAASASAAELAAVNKSGAEAVAAAVAVTTTTTAADATEETTTAGPASTTDPPAKTTQTKRRTKQKKKEPQEPLVGRIPNRRKNNNNRRRRQQNNNNNNTNTSPVNMTDPRWTIYESAFMDPNISHIDFYNNDVPSDFSYNGGSENYEYLPSWLQRYMKWHAWKRTSWNLTDWEHERWIILQCIKTQDKKKCGGTADRLKPVPTLLKLAYMTRRILLIHWDRPCWLEEFLVPPEGGIDWRTPSQLVDVLANSTNGKRLTPYKVIQRYAEGGMALVRARYQTNFPEQYYDDSLEENEQMFNVTFHRIWRTMFTPSDAVRTVIESKMKDFGLLPNQYVAAHLRALYATEKRKIDVIQKFTSNALDCATQLRPGLPIYFASDSFDAIEHAVKLGHPGQVRKSFSKEDFDTNPSTKTEPRVVVSIPDPNPPWHLDQYAGPPEMFYDTFVDLYLMALARCVTYSKGGFGHWALLIGGTPDCTLLQDIIGSHGTALKYPCTADMSSKPNQKLESSRVVTESLYLPPMKDSTT